MIAHLLGFLILAVLIVSVAVNVLFLCIGVFLMGRASQAINKLKTDNVGLQSTLDKANGDLAIAQANAYDADDLAAIDSVLNPPDSNTAAVLADNATTTTANPA